MSFFNDQAIVFPMVIPTRIPVKEPGPFTTNILSISYNFKPFFVKELSIIGKILADKLNKTFVDSDALIVEKYGDIPNIFTNL